MKCERCGRETKPHPYGMQKKYCSAKCRKRAENERYYQKNPDKKGASRRKYPKVLIPWTIEKAKKEMAAFTPMPDIFKPFPVISDKEREKNAERARISRVGKSYVGERAKRQKTDPLYNEKESARAKLRNAVAKGEIEKPSKCQRCGAETKLHGHHYRGYDHPLVVIWLCHPCHAQAHMLNREPTAPLMRL